MNFFFENLSLVPETSAPKEHFKLVFGSGTSDLAKIRPLKNWPPPFPGSHRLLGTSIQTAAQTAAEQRTASGPRCLRWTQLELEWKRRWAFLFFHSLPTSTLRSCFIRRARDGLRATSTPSQACLRGRGRAPNRLHQTIRKLQS